jgi:uncharacterized Fe-S cluster-containing radical SAM superfamily protein
VKTIDTDAFSARMRERGVDLGARTLRITRFTGTEQEVDLTEPANCSGFGRIRHFRTATTPGWPLNPLPIEPACRALREPISDTLRAQAFQNAVCNWRCWYCYVPFELLSADPRFSSWLTAGELIDLYLAEPDRPRVIDLTGGQPDLIPEWVSWTIEALEERGLSQHVYLWSDDNLSTDYYWKYLSEEQREKIANYPLYGRVCCFKGFDATSFAFNTKADPSLYDRQFHLMGRLMNAGIDLYAYVTLTHDISSNAQDAMPRFLDRLQNLDPNLPLRTVPIEISVFTPVQNRLTPETAAALLSQRVAVEVWNREIEQRFTSSEREMRVTAVSLKSRGVALVKQSNTHG